MEWLGITDDSQAKRMNRMDVSKDMNSPSLGFVQEKRAYGIFMEKIKCPGIHTSSSCDSPV